jgi:hypothetical protein
MSTHKNNNVQDNMFAQITNGHEVAVCDSYCDLHNIFIHRGISCFDPVIK